MFDEQMRQVKEQVFHPLARPLLRIPPWVFSLLGLVMGLAAAAALWQQAYAWGLLFWFLNRVLDALDGSVARLVGEQSDFGGYLDILLDFATYALIPIGLAWGRPLPENLLTLTFLLASFYVNAASWMYLAAVLEKQRHIPGHRLTTVTMPAGIIGGTETILFYTAFILFPNYLAWLFGLMGLLTALTILQRVRWAARHI
ncbi:MAG: CDP-alcohol phosphatidyltransferase family protein [Chloroflexi bacterium]|nr:CDP-alcohol phosphatidyltransferase family protein [Ardenticatenaceae bacterium]MBL1129433.1 CDP-alcohol phosphatidyltransferase family protein [Chloroflexota bacterium]NOG35513.1 CDP-alcohol phosphatidyltransferase family protein [Chloroflexota bacterium]GIK57462.1 MAG: phosphatidylglycerophosphate synthase [Chloroflexota bacterium]